MVMNQFCKLSALTMHKTTCLTMALFGFVMLTFAAQADAECCYPNWKGQCDDCTYGDVYCGAFEGDGCNLFGCNCGKGCRRYDPNYTGKCDNRRKSRSPGLEPGHEVAPNKDWAVTGKEIVRTFDADGDRALNAVEVVVFLRRSGVADGDDQWRALDTNLDGKLDASEIDHDIIDHDTTTSVI